MCQGCVDAGRITQEVYDKIEVFAEQWPDAEFGPAHIVIGDDNVDDSSIQWCLDNWDNSVAHINEEYRDEEYAATKEFLKALLAMPISSRVGPNS